jgi:hypothetical protein
LDPVEQALATASHGDSFVDGAKEELLHLGSLVQAVSVVVAQASKSYTVSLEHFKTSDDWML